MNFDPNLTITPTNPSLLTPGPLSISPNFPTLAPIPTVQTIPPTFGPNIPTPGPYPSFGPNFTLAPFPTLGTLAPTAGPETVGPETAGPSSSNGNGNNNGTVIVVPGGNNGGPRPGRYPDRYRGRRRAYWRGYNQGRQYGSTVIVQPDDSVTTTPIPIQAPSEPNYVIILLVVAVVGIIAYMAFSSFDTPQFNERIYVPANYKTMSESSNAPMDTPFVTEKK